MILARLTKAVREQNWFAVLLEFVIVISGVVIGFQIAGVGERAASRAYERDLLFRLHAEIENLQEGRPFTADNLLATYTQLLAVRPIVHGEVPVDALSQRQCLAIMESHTLSILPDSLPSLDELVSTGRMETISSNAIRLAASDFIQKRDFGRNLMPSLVSGLRNLSHNYPQLVFYRLVPDPTETEEDGWDRQVECGLDAMRGNHGFLNDLTNNIEASRVTINFHIRILDESFEALHDAVDQELGIHHQSEGAAP